MMELVIALLVIAFTKSGTAWEAQRSAAILFVPSCLGGRLVFARGCSLLSEGGSSLQRLTAPVSNDLIPFRLPQRGLLRLQLAMTAGRKAAS